MIIKMIAGHTRICGKAQGFLGLPVRDVLIKDPTVGACNSMQTAWEPTPAELAVLNAGGQIVISVLGTVPAPMNVFVEPAEAEQ